MRINKRIGRKERKGRCIGRRLRKERKMMSRVEHSKIEIIN
jgi:hypothetical protein